MTAVLAIESSTVRAGVALVRDDKVVVELVAERPRIHSTWLLPACLEAMKLGATTAEEIACIAVSEGPGSFTGLRIGCAVAQGLAVAWSKPVVMVSSFLVLATGLSLAGWKGGVLLASDFSGASVVSALYTANGRGEAVEIVTPAERTPEAFLAVVVERTKELWREAMSGEVLCAGDSARDLLSELIPSIETGSGSPGNPVFVLADPYMSLPRPGVLAKLGQRFFLEGKMVVAERAIPKYYRKPPGTRARPGL